MKSLLIPVLLCCGHLAIATENPPPIGSVEELDAAVLELLEENGVPGMIGTIVNGDEVVWQAALGLANVELEQPVTPDTLFRVGSISKSIVSLSILRLVERGQLSLEDLISDLAPEAGVENPWEATDPVRLVHTLEHTAGFDDIHFRDFTFNDPDVTTLEGIRFNTTSRRVRWRPGTRMAYSNIGPAIAALAMENVTGIAFEEFAGQEIFALLGMDTATFFHNGSVATSYRPDGSASPYFNIPVRPSGSLNAASGDMARLLMMFIGRGSLEGRQIVSPESIDRMETPTTTLASQQGLETGYGLGSFTSFYNGFLFHGHNGGIDGFVSSYAYLPQARRGYFVSINQSDYVALQELELLLRSYLTGDLSAPEPEPVLDIPTAELRRFEGVYEPDSPRIDLVDGMQRIVFTSVRAQQGYLELKPLLGPTTRLLPVDNSQFRRERDPVATHVFVTSPDDEKLLQLGMSTLRQVNPVWAYGRTLLLLYAALILASSLILSAVWLIRSLTRNAISVRNVGVHPVVTVHTITTVVFLSYLALLLLVTASPNIGNLTPLTAGYWVVSLVLPVGALLSLTAVVFSFRRRQVVGAWYWHHALHTALAQFVALAFLVSFGFIGLQTWAY